MESHRIVLCLAMLTACVMAVQSATIAQQQPMPVAPAAEQPQFNTDQPQPQSVSGHQRDKKWAVPFISTYSALPYTAFSYPTAYSALPYYSAAYRSLPLYTPYIY